MDQNLKKGLLKGTLITSAGQIFTVALLFIGTMLLARFMPAKELGTFFLMVAVWMFLEMFSTLGLEAVLVKYLSASPKEEMNDTFIKLFLIRLVYVLIISVIFFSVSKFFTIIEPILNDYVLFIIIIFILDSLRSFFNAALQGAKKFRELIIVQITQASSKILLYTAGILFLKLTVSYLIYTEILTLVLSFMVQQYFSSIKYKLNTRIRFKEIKEILFFAFPLYMNNILGVFANRTNSIIIAGFTNVVNVAYYEVGKKIPDGLGRLSSSVILVFYPYISELFAASKIHEAKELIEKYINYITLISAPILLAVFLFREDIMLLVFTEKYLESSMALFLFTISFYFSIVSNILGYSLVAAGKPAVSFQINLTRTVIALLLSFFLVNIIGFMGAVYSIAFSSVFGWLLSFWYLKKISLKIIPIRFLYPLILSFPYIILSYQFWNSRFKLQLFLALFLLFLIVEYIFFKDFRYLIITLKTKILKFIGGFIWKRNNNE